MNREENKTKAPVNLSLKSWSDRESRVKTLAVYQMDDDGAVSITVAPEVVDYFDSIGMEKVNDKYRMNLDYAPSGMVAKAFGMDFNDTEVREQVFASAGTITPTGRQVFYAAFEGISSQLGNITPADAGERIYTKVPKSGVVSPSAITINDGYAKMGERSVGGLHFEEIIVRNDNRLEHAYLVSPTTNDQAGRERLAMYLATIDGLRDIPGMQTDDTLGLKFSSNMTPKLLMLDKSRPAMDIVSGRNAEEDCFQVHTDTFKARRGMVGVENLLDNKNKHLFESYSMAMAVKRLTTNAQGFHTSTPKVGNGVLYSGRVFVSESMNKDSFMNRLRKQVTAVDDDFNRMHKMYQYGCTAQEKDAWQKRSESICDEAITKMEKVAQNVLQLTASIENLVERHAGNVYEQEDKAIRERHLEYDANSFEV